MRVGNENALGKTSGERIVYVRGNKMQREKALELIRSNPKVPMRRQVVHVYDLLGVEGYKMRFLSINAMAKAVVGL